MKDPWFHRLRQVLDHLNPRPLAPSQLAWVERYLNPAERALFFATRPSDKRHALAVARAVSDAAELSLRERWVITQAALLHDVGKRQERATLAVRVGNVLFPEVWPGWLPAGLGEAVQELRGHPARGAGWVRKAGAEPAVVALVRWHEPSGDPAAVPAVLRPLLELLQRADARH